MSRRVCQHGVAEDHCFLCAVGNPRDAVDWSAVRFCAALAVMALAVVAAVLWGAR